MGIYSEKIASVSDNDVVLFKIQNSGGSYVEFINYGATLLSIVVPDQNGNLDNVILNYPDVQDYFSDSSYLGSTIGRFANRIAGARFELDGTAYLLDKNDGQNSNHGGFNGFNNQIFKYRLEDESVILFLKSIDDDGGFPGNLQFSVRYSFSETNELEMEYSVISDKTTIFNPTNHAYFNLSAGKESILNHELRVFAEKYLESSDEFLPTGKILDVAETAFDFRTFRNIGQMASMKKEILEGYNTYFIHPEEGNVELKGLATLKENTSGRILDVYSTMPGIQIYTGDYLGGKHQPFEGICMEAQLYPDSPNHPLFPSCIIYPNSEKTYKIMYRFGYF